MVGPNTTGMVRAGSFFASWRNRMTNDLCVLCGNRIVKYEWVSWTVRGLAHAPCIGAERVAYAAKLRAHAEGVVVLPPSEEVDRMTSPDAT